MKTKIKFIIVFSLALSFVFFSTCKRKALEEPSPLGPSSLSVILNLSASPNIIKAGSSRQATTITATLKKYDRTPLANTTIYFEIRDGSGNKVYIGYFEDNQSVITKTTNNNGKVKVTYYGPLGEELSQDTTIYIYASAAWQGKEFISELAPLNIVRDYEEILIDLYASPNVLVAGTYREVSTITATVEQSGGTPFSNTTVIFKIPVDESGNPLGYFENSKTVVEKTTDKNGTAQVTYFGPTSQEVTEDTTVEIKAWLPDFIEEGAECCTATTSICIVREISDLTLELFANPNVLYCSSEESASQIIAYLKKGSAPIANRRIYFTVTASGPGEFSNGKATKSALTNEEGMATVTYYGPTKDEITADQTVTIQAQAETSSSDSVTATVDITLIRDTSGLTLEITADPNVLLCTNERPTSQIKAYFKEGNTALSGRLIYFIIPSGLGLFSNDKTTKSALTNEEGMATVTYYGPTNSEITADQTITMQAQAETSSSDFITATVEIKLLRQD